MPIRQLLDDFSHHASTYRATAFANSKAQTFFHGNRCNQRYRHRNVITRQNHLLVLGQVNGTGDVRRTEVKLRTIAFEKWRMTTTLFLGKNVDLGSKISVRLDGARSSQYLTTLDIFTLGTAQQYTHVITCLPLVKQLAEHLNTSTSRLGGLTDTNNLDLVTNPDDTALYTTGDNSTTTGNGENVFNRHQESTVNSTIGRGNVLVQSVGQLDDGLLAQWAVVALEGQLGGTRDNGGVVAREVVVGQQLAHFHLDQLEQLFVVNHVGLVQKHNNIRNTDRAAEQNVLACLRHGAVSSRNHQNSAVHLSSTGNHVLDVVSVTGAVNVSVVTLGRLVRSEEHTSELQSRGHLVCRLLLEKKK